MPTLYAYDEETIFDLDQLLIDIAASSMTDKVVDYTRWDEEPGVTDEGLCVFFVSPLSGADETLLDAVVAAI